MTSPSTRSTEMNWPNFFLGMFGGWVLTLTACVAWYTFRPTRRGHMIYRKGQPPERVW